MKKLNYLLLAPAALLLASCSQEAIEAPVNGDGNTTTFTVKLPKGVTTRDNGDGLTATVLNVAVYDGDNFDAANPGTPEFIYDFPANFEGKIETTVEFNFVKNKNYVVAFFAQAAPAEANTPSIYTWDAEAGTIKVDYEAMNSAGTNADLYDCFVNYAVSGGTGEGYFEVGSLNNEVTLYRPIAQICWLTDDLTEKSSMNVFGPNGEKLQSSLQVDGGVPQMLNIFNKEFVGDNYTEPLNWMTIPTGYPVPKSVPTNNPPYQWMATQFVLAPYATASVNNFTLTVNELAIAEEGDESVLENDIILDVKNAPLEANYQTVIYGSLLSSNTTFTVVKEEEWGGHYYQEYPVVAPPTDDNGNYLVSAPEHLAWINSQLTQGYTGTHFEGKTFILQNNLDLSEMGNWAPIGSYYRTDSDFGYYFAGTFDGQGYTIEGLTVNGVTDCGLFGYVMGGTIKDLTITGANVKGYSWVGVVAGRILNGNIEGVTVTDSYVEAMVEGDVTLPSGVYFGQEAGIIAGNTTNYPQDNSFSINNCTVTNCEVTGYTRLGGVVGGLMITAPIITECEVNDLTINVNNSNNYSELTQAEAGEEQGYDNYMYGPVYGGISLEEYGVPSTENVKNNKVGTYTINFESTTLEGLQSAPNGEGDVVSLPDDITGAASSEYGLAGNVAGLEVNGGTLNGNGNTLTVTGATSKTNDCAIYSTGGTINDLTVSGGYKTILVKNPTSDFNMNKVTINGYVYGLNCEGNGTTLTLNATDCVLNGWNSWAAFGQANFTNCKFGMGEKYNVVKPWRTSVFTECDFAEGIYFYAEEMIAGGTMTFVNCTYNGEPLTAENFVETVGKDHIELATGLLSANDNTELFNQIFVIK